MEKPKAVKPRGIEKIGNICYANALFQRVEQQLPDDYTELLADILLPVPGVSDILQTLPTKARKEVRKEHEKIMTALSQITKVGLYFVPWRPMFPSELKKERVRFSQKKFTTR